MARVHWMRALLVPIFLLGIAAAQPNYAEDLARLPPTQTLPLSSAPGCGSAEIAAQMDYCILQDFINIGDIHEYTLVIPQRTQNKPFSLLVTVKSTGGRVKMFAVGPRPGVFFEANTTFILSSDQGSALGHTAMMESYMRIRGHDLTPGTWKIRVFAAASDRKATIYTLRIQAPLTSTRLAAPEKTALARIVGECCDVRRIINTDLTNPSLCALILPYATQTKTSVTTDICQVGPFMCTADGRLQKLMLGGAGLSCPSFPTAISSFEGLHTLEVQLSTFGRDTFDNVAKVLAPLANLERLLLRDTDLSGTLPCELTSDKPILKVLDISDTQAMGQLPPCIFESKTLEELYMSRTRLVGPLPDSIPVNSHLRVLYAWNKDKRTDTPWPYGGFSGPLPTSLRNAASLTDLVMPFHQMEGPIAGLPDALDWLDLKGNRISEMPAKLPLDLRILDLSGNGMTGSIPDFSETTLIWVNLTSNQLTGQLPKDFGMAEDIIILSMANNSITGDLDNTNWEMVFLELLDISNNKITGVLPASLASLPRLNFLNLAHNQIGGTLDEFANALPVPTSRRRRLLSRSAAPRRAAAVPGARSLLQAVATGAASAAAAPAAAAHPIHQKPLTFTVGKQPPVAPPRAVPSSAAATVSAAPRNSSPPPLAGGAAGPGMGAADAKQVDKTYTGSKITILDLSYNMLEGGVPRSLSRLGVFNWIQEGPPDRQLYHYLILSNNNLWDEIPAFMLEAVAVPADRNLCRCTTYLDLSNNTRFCPTKATVNSLGEGIVDSLTSKDGPDISCMRSDFKPTTLMDYLLSGSFSTSVPPAPPLKRPIRTPEDPNRGGSGGGGGGGGGGGPARGLGAGAIAGVVVGVVALLGIVAALGVFVLRPRLQERRATGFFKTKELDHPPDPFMHAGAPDGAAAAAGWGRFAPSGPGSEAEGAAAPNGGPLSPPPAVLRLS